MTPTPSHAPLTPPQARVIGAAFGATLRCTTSGNFKTPNPKPPTPNPQPPTPNPQASHRERQPCSRVGSSKEGAAGGSKQEGGGGGSKEGDAGGSSKEGGGGGGSKEGGVGCSSKEGAHALSCAGLPTMNREV